MVVQLDRESRPTPYLGLRMTADEFLALPEDSTRYELVDGVVIMSPSPTFWHQDVVVEILFQIRSFLELHPIGRVVCDVDVRLRHDLVYRPDVVFLSNDKLARLEARIDEPPDLVVEVVSPDSRGFDTKTKRDDYQAAGVAEYWVIDPARKVFLFFVLDSGRFVESPVIGDKYPAKVLPALQLDLQRLRRLF